MPLSMQCFVWWVAGQSVDQHLLSSYHYAILSIILAQFTCKGFSDGMEGIVRIVEAAPKLQVSFHQTIQHTELTMCLQCLTQEAPVRKGWQALHVTSCMICSCSAQLICSTFEHFELLEYACPSHGFVLPPW